MPRIVIIDCDGEVQSHMESDGSYATVCGLDGDDPGIKQKTLPSLLGTKINCQQCISIWKNCRKYKPSHFVGTSSGEKA